MSRVIRRTIDTNMFPFRVTSHAWSCVQKAKRIDLRCKINKQVTFIGFRCHSSLDWSSIFPSIPYFLQDWQYTVLVFIRTPTEFSSTSGKRILSFVTQWCRWLEKSYVILPALFSLIVELMRDFKSQTIYSSTHWLICSHDHESFFVQYDLYQRVASRT